MRVLCKNTWKKIGSILLCCCILFTDIQLPNYVSAKESETEYQAEQCDDQSDAYVITSAEEQQWYEEKGSDQNAYPENDLPIETVSEADTTDSLEESDRSEAVIDDCAIYADSAAEPETEETEEEQKEDQLVAEVKAMIAALPEVGELDGLEEEKRDQVYLDAQDAWDAYEALTEEQQALLAVEKEKLDGVLKCFEIANSTADNSKDWKEPNNAQTYGTFSGYCGSGYNLWITAGTSGGTAIYYREGDTADGTIKYINPSGAAGDDLSNTDVTGSVGYDQFNKSHTIYMSGGTIKNLYTSVSKNKGNVTVIITGGTVKGVVSTGQSYNSGTGGTRHIFSSVNISVSTQYRSFNSSLVKNGSNWVGSGNATIPSGATMKLDAGTTFTMSGGTLTNNGTIVNNGAAITGNWTLVNNGTVTCNKHSYRSSGTPCSNGDDTHSYPCYFCADALDTANAQDCTFDDYGFCTVCDGYQMPECGVDWRYPDRYYITLPGHLFWLAQKVNAGNSDLLAMLGKDIDLNADGKNRQWIPIGKTNSTSFLGGFYGMGYTISNLKQDITSNGDYGLFGYVKNGSIENFFINGEVTMNCGGIRYGVVGEMEASGEDDCTVKNVYSSVNVNVLDSEEKQYIGGIVGTVNGNDCHIEKCSFSGTIAFNSAKVDCGGGIVGYIGYQNEAYIKNCLFDGTITSSNGNSNNQIGGIFGYYNGDNDPKLRVQNCLSVGTIALSNTTLAGAVGGRYRVQNSIPITEKYCDNNYYSSESLPAFADDIDEKSDYSDSVARLATTKELAHGGICWLLNGKPGHSDTTDAKHIWRQTIGTDNYPNFSGAKVYGIEGKNAAYGRNDTETITEVNGYYEIYTPIQLVIFQEFVDVGNHNACGKLMADIDMSGYTWTPICITGLYYSGDYTDGDNYPDNGYAGVFNGNGHVIKNLTVNGNSGKKETYGLFGTSSGMIENLGIETFTFNLNGASDIRTGAIVGQNLDGVIMNCYAANVTINADTYVKGGIAGCNYRGAIMNCHTYNLTISGTNTRFGGIVGDNRADGSETDRQGTLKNCYTTFSTLLGNQTGVETDCEAGVSIDRFASGEITWLLNGSNIWNVRWKQTIGTDSYPNFSGLTVYKSGENYENSESPEITDGTYYIYNKKQLIEFAQVVNSGNTGSKGIMMADIDISDVSNFAIGNTESMPFTGTFDGNGHTLTVGLSGESTVAPFPYVKAAKIQNLVVDGTITITKKYAGGLIGQTIANGGETTISQCLSRVTINSSQSGDGTHGGLVGVVNSGSPCTITNCGFSGAINGSSTSNCGGMVGWTNAKVKITNSYVAGEFNIDNTGSMTFGRNETGNWYTLTNCYYLNALVSDQGATQKSVYAFLCGEVTYLLNNKKASGVWKQTLNTCTTGTDTTGTSDYPIFQGLSVYQMDSSIERGYVNYEPPEKNSSGIYEIKTADNLMAFAQYVNFGSYSANAKVMADISMSGYSGKWVPIARTTMANEISYGYTGTFDGNGHTISDISFGTTTAKCTNGLFGTVYNGGVVKHVGVTNLTFDDNTYDHRAAGIAGQLMYGGLIEDCFVADSTIKAATRVVGGIAAMNLGTIRNCYTKGLTLAAHTDRFGGICGDYKGNTYSNNENGKVINCYTDYAAIGSTASGNVGTMENSECGVTAERFASGEITYLLNGKADENTIWFQTIGTDDYPAFSGKVVHYGQEYCGENPPMIYSNDDWIDSHTPEYNDDGFCTHLLPNGKVCDAYQPCTGEGTSESPYKISNAGQLYWFGAVVNTGYQAVERNLSPYGELTKDIKVNTNVLKDGELNEAEAASFRVWTPIGRGDYQFKGVFAGNNHTVSGLYYDDATQGDLGFFGSCLGRVSGLILDDIYLHGRNAVGGIAGYMRENTISDCGVKNALIVGNSNVGGVVGNANRRGTLSRCYSGATVSGSSYLGGIAGIVQGNTIENCYQYGSVSGESNVGSLVGFANIWQIISSKISYCHSYVADQLMLGGKNSGSGIANVSIHHCYYLADEEVTNEDGTTGKTAEQFQSGEVAWLLNRGTVGTPGSAITDGTQVWYQDLGTDAYPTFAGGTVYYGYRGCFSEKTEYANSYLSPTAGHHYDIEPYFSWSIDYRTCKAIFLCSADASHETREMTCEISSDITDPNETVYTASVTLDGTTYTDTRTTENTVLSVAVSWDEMEFDYTPSQWNAAEHKYNKGSWSPTKENGDVLTVTNTGTVNLEVSASYEIQEESVNATVTVKDSDTNAFRIAPGKSQDVTLALDGELKEKTQNQRIGTLVLRMKESILDLTDVDVEVYPETIADYLADSDGTLTLKLGTDTLTTAMGTAIQTGIKQAGITECKLTLLDAETIDESAFEGFTNLKKVSLPEAVALKAKAFEGCSGLTNIYCPKVKEVGPVMESWVFGGCTSLEEIILPEAIMIGFFAFNGCSALKYVELPKMEKIYPGAFTKCAALKALYLPNATFIGVSTFSGCTALTSVNAPTLTFMDSMAFENCSALQYIRMPQLESLYMNAIESSSLTTATFPRVTVIYSSALARCSNLKTLTFGSVIETITAEDWLGDPSDSKAPDSENITLTLNKAQAESSNCPADFEAKTFGGYTFQSIQVYEE